MRWVASLFALSLMMALFHRLTEAGPLEARATLALGFLLLAAFLGGDLAKKLHLPRITGFLVTGFIVGPAWFGLVREDEVTALRFISDATVALIAFAAGSALTLGALREQRTALVRLATGAIVFPFVAVTLVVLTVTPWFPLTVHQPFGDAATAALVLGVLAAASSPAVTMALITELEARGRFSRAILSTTIVQDVVVVLLLTLVLALGKALASSGALNLGLAGTALWHLGGSVAAGVALGVLLDQYLRRVQRDTALFLVATAFVTAEVARLTGVETMLVAVTAGFYLENFSPVQGERLRAELKRGALPVYVVFFALAGAGLHVGALAELWPWVLLLIGLRAVSLRAGMRWAGRHAAVTPDLARDGWLGLISQAGMALGLAQVARRAFPEWGISLETLLVTMIGVHEVVGPICFRRALIRVGEVTEGEHDARKPEMGGPAVAAAGGGL
jgi:Kef-type K+ transport system membrane component KefB